MSQDVSVYDLGEIESMHDKPRVRPPGPVGETGASVRSRADFRTRTPRPLPRRPSDALPRTLALFVPGSAQVLRGDLRKGLFFLVSMGFLAALAWGIYRTLDRLGPTLGVLGFRPESGVWALAALYGAAAALHLGNVFGAVRERAASDAPRIPPRFVAAVASALLPGWGQLLNGNRRRAVLFLAACWSVGAAWLLVSPPVQALLTTQNLFLPLGLVWFCSPLVRWTAPAVIWSLAVYDAMVSKSLRSAA